MPNGLDERRAVPPRLRRPTARCPASEREQVCSTACRDERAAAPLEATVRTRRRQTAANRRGTHSAAPRAALPAVLQRLRRTDVALFRADRRPRGPVAVPGAVASKWHWRPSCVPVEASATARPPASAIDADTEHDVGRRARVSRTVRGLRPERRVPLRVRLASGRCQRQNGVRRKMRRGASCRRMPDARE